MNDYISLQSRGEGVWYKAKILNTTWADITDPAAVVQKTMGGVWAMTFGYSSDTWAGTIKIRKNDGAGYITLAKIKDWASSKFYTYRQLYMRDFNYDTIPVVYPVFMQLEISPNYIDPMLESGEVPVVLLRRGAAII